MPWRGTMGFGLNTINNPYSPALINHSINNYLNHNLNSHLPLPPNIINPHNPLISPAGIPVPGIQPFKPFKYLNPFR